VEVILAEELHKPVYSQLELAETMSLLSSPVYQFDISTLSDALKNSAEGGCGSVDVGVYPLEWVVIKVQDVEDEGTGGKKGSLEGECRRESNTNRL
jgi:hypothetical protein